MGDERRVRKEEGGEEGEVRCREHVRNEGQ